jgi:hypothetical protein
MIVMEISGSAISAVASLTSLMPGVRFAGATGVAMPARFALPHRPAGLVRRN